MIRPLLAAIALLAVAAPSAAANGGSAADAEIFATNNTATITDQKDPRLQARLNGFADRVERIIREGGAKPRGSELLDGVFCCDLTFERSRRFDVHHTSRGELHDIAETVRRRFLQGSVLTFDRLSPKDPHVDAIELDVPKVSAKALRDGLLDDSEAASRLFGGSVTQDKHLLLVAAAEDADFARAFAEQIGGDVKHASTAYGKRELVSAATDGRARVEQRTLIIAGTPQDDTIALRDGRRLEIDFGDDGVIDFEVSFRRFDRIRFEGGDGRDTIISHARELDLSAGMFDGIELIDLVEPDRVSVGDLSSTAVEEVDVHLGSDGAVDHVVTDGSDDQDQILVAGFQGAVSVLGPTYVTIDGADRFDRLRVNGRRGDDIISTSTDLMKMTLASGRDGATLLGGPGDDVLIGSDGFDDAVGGKGNDVARLGGYFDRFSWRAGDGTDDVDGGASRDSLSLSGTNQVEVFDFFRFGHDIRFVHDPGAEAIDLRHIEEVDPFAGGGEDLFGVRDLSGTGLDLLDISLGSGFPGGDNAADRIDVDGTGNLAVVGKKVIAGTTTLTGLPYKVNLTHSEPLDTLAIHGGTVDASGLPADVITLETD
jgi:Ca2+-binding RTX toxin-like protein